MKEKLTNRVCAYYFRKSRRLLFAPKYKTFFYWATGKNIKIFISFLS